MSKDERVANVVLGGGESGKHLAWELARQGEPVVVIERGLDRRLVPEHRVPAEQERDPQREGREPRARTAPSTAYARRRVTVDMEGVRARKRAMVDEEIAFHRKSSPRRT